MVVRIFSALLAVGSFGGAMFLLVFAAFLSDPLYRTEPGPVAEMQPYLWLCVIGFVAGVCGVIWGR